MEGVGSVFYDCLTFHPRAAEAFGMGATIRACFRHSVDGLGAAAPATRGRLFQRGLSLDRAEQLQMPDAKRERQLVDRDDGGIPPPSLEPADILLAEAGALGELLLRQAFLLPHSSYISPDQLAHVHAPRSAEYIL